jgi:hypothetical protein
MKVLKIVVEANRNYPDGEWKVDEIQSDGITKREAELLIELTSYFPNEFLRPNSINSVIMYRHRVVEVEVEVES